MVDVAPNQADEGRNLFDLCETPCVEGPLIAPMGISVAFAGSPNVSRRRSMALKGSSEIAIASHEAFERSAKQRPTLR
jgi:hypothetical protein